ncbi:MAG: DNA repair protein RecO [Fusobacteriaceae bacterium]
MKLIQSEGLVIGRNDFGEADSYITIITEEFGKISFAIKGIRKSKRREQSAVDLLSLSKFILVKKEENYTLNKFENIDYFDGLKKNIDKISISLYIISLVNNFMIESFSYNLTIKTLKAIENEENESKNLLMLAYYMLKIIQKDGILDEDFQSWKFLREETFEREIIESILAGKIKTLLLELDTKFSKEKLLSTILILENYININTDFKLNIKKYLLG